jgi:hypothetical protein
LGLTSDDEDYIDPNNYEDRENPNSADSEAKLSSSSSTKLTNAPTTTTTTKIKRDSKKSKNSSSSSSSLVILKPTEKNLVIALEPQATKTQDHLLTDMSGTSSDSDSGNNKMDGFVNNVECNSMHEGRQLVHTILPLNIETVFGLLFHKSKFFSEFHKMRKTENLVQGEWEDQEDGTKRRVQKLTVAITQLVGPKSSHVTETQTMRSCSVPGVLYSIDAVSENAGE